MSHCFYSILAIFGLTLATVCLAGNLSAQCEDIHQYPIADLSSGSLNLIIENAIVDDLSDPSQGVCGVNLRFRHAFVGDLKMTLSSPAGQSVDLIGPVGEFGRTDFTVWNINFISCNSPASPDTGFEDLWSNNQPWGLFGVYSGNYYPEVGCFEDINMGPVNGIWSLTIDDQLMFNEGVIESFSLIFCNNSGLECQQCLANGGSFQNTDTLSYCKGDKALLLDVNPFEGIDTLDGVKYQYLYTYSVDDTVIGMLDSIDLRAFEPGLYKICGLSFLFDQNFNVEDFILGKTDEEILELSEMPNPLYCFSRSSNCLTIQINVSPELSSRSEDLSSCMDSTLLTIDVLPSESTINWSGPFNFLASDDSVYVHNPGMYTIIAELDDCADSMTIEVTYNGTLPQVSIDDPDTIRCIDPVVGLSATTNISNANFLWTDPAQAEHIDSTLNANLAGIYKLVLMFGDQCMVADSVELISSIDIPNVDIFSDTANCVNEFAEIRTESQFNNLSFSWMGPEGFTSTDSSILAMAPGEYFLTVTNEESCIYLDSTEVIFEFNYPEIDSLVEGNLDCDKPSIDIGAFTSTNDERFFWTGPSGFESIEQFTSVTIPGSYNLLVQNDDSCALELLFNVSQDTLVPEIELLPDTLDCSKDSLQLMVVTLEDYSNLIWSGPEGFQSMEISPYITTPGDYSLIFTGINGCSVSRTLSVAIDTSAPIVNVSNGNLPCDDSPYFLPAMSEELDVTLEWTGPDNFSSAVLSPQIQVPGTYTLVAVKPNGCSLTDSLEITDEIVLPNYSISSFDMTCLNDTAAIQLQLQAEIRSLIWNGPMGFQSDSNSLDLTLPGLYKVEIIGTNGCIAVDSVIIEADTIAPVLEIMEPEPLLCEHTAIQLESSVISEDSDLSILWSTTEGIIQSGEQGLTPVIASMGRYYLKVADNENGCTSLDSVDISESLSDLTKVDFSISHEKCEGSNDGIFILGEIYGGEMPFLFHLNGIEYTELDSITNLAPGEHMITLKDSFGCTLDTFFQVLPGYEIGISLDDIYEIGLGDTIIIVPDIFNESMSDVDLEWNTEGVPFRQIGMTIEISPVTDTRIFITAINEEGCIDSVETLVRVDDNSDVYIPNVFYPQSVSNNNIFRVFPGGSVSSIEEISVFDRWGNLVYSAANINTSNTDYGWDGTFQGQILQPAVYVYLIKIVLINGEKKQIHGNVTLLK